MVRNIIILFGSPITQHVYEYFGGDIFKKNGFELKLLDLSPIIHPQLFKGATVVEDYKGDDKEIIFYRKEVLKRLSSLKEDSLVLNCLYYNLDSCDFYRAISKSNAFHTVEVDVAVPLFEDGPTQKQFLSKLRKITIPKLINFAIQNVKPFLVRNFSRPPDFLIAGGESSIKHMSNGNLAGKSTEILWTHTSDYNKYLAFRETRETIDYKPTAVFLCGSAPMFLRDNLAMNDTCPLTIDVYYPSLCRFFDKIESELSLTVEIAGHPGANHPKNPDYLGGRLALKGQTIEMIARSKVVLTHGSAAINFAVLFNKPIIQFITDQFQRGLSNEHIVSSWLGTDLINIDKSLDHDWEKLLEIDKKAYQNYKQHFIKKSGTDDINLWQIMANKIKRI